MLYFSKLRILFITLFSVLFILIASSNLFKFDDNFFDKKINLGLDLQGGSYLLLEIDNEPVIEQKLQNLTTTIRNYFKEKNIKINNIKIDNQNIFFNVTDNDKQSVLDVFQDENSDLNPYYPRFKSHQLEIEDTGLNFKVNFSRQGLIKLKTSSQDQAIEIVRRRVDEVGTNEPNILKRGNNRILVELPGLDDPMRIKSLLGKTANLTFRFVTNDEKDRIGVEKTPRSDVGNKITTGLGDTILDNRRKKEYYDKLGQDAREARQKMIRDKFNKMRDEAKVKADASAARNPVRSQNNQQSGKTKEQMRKSIINRQMKSFMKRNPLPKDTLKPNLAQTLLNNARNIVKRNKQMRNSPDYKAQKPKRNINKKFTTESMGRIEAERVARENNPVGSGGRMRTYKEIQNDKAKQDLIKKKRPTSVISQNNESYSHWREEFIWETDKKYPDKIKEIKPMSGKNTITINPEDETSKYKRGY